MGKVVIFCVVLALVCVAIALAVDDHKKGKK